MDSAAGGASPWQLLDLLPSPCLVVTPAARQVVHANPAADHAALGRVAYDAPAAYHATDVHGQRIQAADLPRHLAAVAGSPDGAEITWHTPDQAFVFRVHARPLPARPEDPALVVLIFLDRTGQKAAETELRQALEARNQFFSVAAHELKDPLFALQLSIQLVQRSAQKLGLLPPALLQHLEIGERQIDRLARLTENLLDAARLMSGRIQMDLETVDLVALAHDTVGRFQAWAEAAGSSLAVEGREPLVGYFDRLKLEQVLANLLSNAIKYGAGRPITVRFRREADQAVLEVEDQGVGVPPDSHTR